MKKYVLFFTVILVINLICLDNASSQEKSAGKSATKQSKKESQPKSVKNQSNIDGLGIFKIGKTKISIIDDLENEFGAKSSVVNSYSEERFNAKGKSNTILQLFPENKSGYCPDVKEYLIPVYNIADMQIKGLELKFYKDVLFEIKCDSSKELLEALVLKYGVPKTQEEKKPISCIYKFTGNKVNYEENTITFAWVNGNIGAVNVCHSFYNDECKKLLVEFLSIYDSKMSGVVRTCEMDINEQNKSTEKQDRLKKLKDF